MVKLDDNIKLATLAGIPYSGWVKYFYPSEALHGLVQLDKGIAHGLHSYWHENGHKKEVAEWMDGRRNGVTTIWYENGRKEFESTYRTVIKREYVQSGMRKAGSSRRPNGRVTSSMD